MGEVPSWYSRIKTAQYLGVPPWELDDQPIWERRAEVARNAEIEAENQLRNAPKE